MSLSSFRYQARCKTMVTQPCVFKFEHSAVKERAIRKSLKQHGSLMARNMIAVVCDATHTVSKSQIHRHVRARQLKRAMRGLTNSPKNFPEKPGLKWRASHPLISQEDAFELHKASVNTTTPSQHIKNGRVRKRTVRCKADFMMRDQQFQLFVGKLEYGIPLLKESTNYKTSSKVWTSKGYRMFDKRFLSKYKSIATNGINRVKQATLAKVSVMSQGRNLLKRSFYNSSSNKSKALIHFKEECAKFLDDLHRKNSTPMRNTVDPHSEFECTCRSGWGKDTLCSSCHRYNSYKEFNDGVTHNTKAKSGGVGNWARANEDAPDWD